MDISKLSDTTLSSGNRPLVPADLFKQLSQLGSMEARVSLISKGQALLNSQLGQILSTDALDLKAGDRLLLRAAGSEQAPVLKIRKLPPPPVTLSISTNQNLSKALPTTQPVTALVIGQQSGNSVLQLGDQRITVQPQIDIKSGQLISLEKSADGKNIEVRPISHQQILKSAINQLLPQHSNPQQTTALTQLTNIIQAIASGRNTQGVDAVRSQPGNLFSRLEAMVASLPQLSKLNQSTIQQWVRYLVVASESKPVPLTTIPNPFQLLQQMPKSEASVSQQLQQWARPVPTPNSQAQSAHIDARTITDDLLSNMGREVIKLIEQTIGQQLLQQTNLRYQQELQQPINFNLTIPLTDQQKIQELRLKIKQGKSDAEPEKQSWDIHLDFEFGLLGLISTHLLLDGNTLSASFWSGKVETQQKIDSNLSEFQAHISRAGFDLGQFHSFPGSPPETTEKTDLAIPDTLLDIRV